MNISPTTLTIITSLLGSIVVLIKVIFDRVKNRGITKKELENAIEEVVVRCTPPPSRPSTPNADRDVLKNMRVSSYIMDELLEALSQNGFARPSATLDSIVANTLQDAMYSPGAVTNARILMRYQGQYGQMTVAEIKALVS